MPLSQEAKKTVIMFVRLTDLDYQGKLEWYSKAEARQVCLEYKKSLMASPMVTVHGKEQYNLGRVGNGSDLSGMNISFTFPGKQ